MIIFGPSLTKVLKSPRRRHFAMLLAFQWNNCDAKVDLLVDEN